MSDEIKNTFAMHVKKGDMQKIFLSRYNELVRPYNEIKNFCMSARHGRI